MMLCDLRRCRMVDAVLALLRSRACSTASTATLLRSRAAVAQCLLQGCALLELLPGASETDTAAAAY